MATTPELKEALKSAADTIAKYVQDIATMSVETRYVELGSKADESKLAASTLVRLDGDSVNIIAMKPGPDGTLVVDTVVNSIHHENVQTAIDYRTGMLEKLVNILKG